MFENYKTLKNTSNCIITKAKLLGNSIFFNYVPGKSLGYLLIESVRKKDKNTFYKLLEEYIVFLSNLAPLSLNTGPVIFAKDLGFHELCFDIGNLDLNFDNIIVDEKGNYTVVDYEWVFPNIPIRFIIYRAIINFFIKHEEYVKNLVNMGEFFYNLGFGTESINLYNKLENGFQNYVYGNPNLGNLRYQKNRLNIINHSISDN